MKENITALFLSERLIFNKFGAKKSAIRKKSCNIMLLKVLGFLVFISDALFSRESINVLTVFIVKTGDLKSYVRRLIICYMAIN